MQCSLGAFSVHSCTIVSPETLCSSLPSRSLPGRGTSGRGRERNGNSTFWDSWYRTPLTGRFLFQAETFLQSRHGAGEIEGRRFVCTITKVIQSCLIGSTRPYTSSRLWSITTGGGKGHAFPVHHRRGTHNS